MMKSYLFTDSEEAKRPCGTCNTPGMHTADGNQAPIVP